MSDEDKKPREFWIEPSYIKNFGLGKGVVAYFEEPPIMGLIHVREVLPEEITDTERLEWLIEKECAVFSQHSKFHIVDDETTPITKNFKTPREAIDAAIKDSK